MTRSFPSFPFLLHSTVSGPFTPPPLSSGPFPNLSIGIWKAFNPLPGTVVNFKISVIELPPLYKKWFANFLPVKQAFVSYGGVKFEIRIFSKQGYKKPWVLTGLFWVLLILTGFYCFFFWVLLQINIFCKEKPNSSVFLGFHVPKCNEMIWLWKQYRLNFLINHVYCVRVKWHFRTLNATILVHIMILYQILYAPPPKSSLTRITHAISKIRSTDDTKSHQIFSCFHLEMIKKTNIQQQLIPHMPTKLVDKCYQYHRKKIND